ncbi:hypothetical protein DM02DRAFT_711504 [Periconia macrospinosa]|uniref:Secreted protein n=1 Tax=Periconia macrospinosa TaxID=97972 RepID=A0A2V1DMR5_9PLEO|nr:hypothetical protein DM02DRAFT_711504 [Periconia macrospinosa]
MPSTVGGWAMLVRCVMFLSLGPSITSMNTGKGDYDVVTERIHNNFHSLVYPPKLWRINNVLGAPIEWRPRPSTPVL